jgi:predicted permease
MNLITGLKSLFQKKRVEAELDEELSTYLEASAADKQRRGSSPEAARRLAAIEMGSRNSVKQQVWQSRWESALDNFQQDIRFSIRSLAKSPGFTLIALLSLALGIGANTAIFTLIHQVLLRNLPVSHPEQLVTFGKSESGGILGGVDIGFYDDFPWYFARQLESAPGPFQGIASYGSFSGKVSIRVPAASGSTSNSAAILAPASLVSGNYFTVIGAQPILGRAIDAADAATPGSGAVVVLSHHFWQQSLSSDPAILGKSLTINGTPFTVIGVMAASFHGIKQELEPPGLWTPITMQPQIFLQPTFLDRSGPYFLHVFARLSPQAAKDKAAFTQAQNWFDQQLRNGIRANEGAAPSPARLLEISRATVPLVPAAQGVSNTRAQYGDSLQILMAIVAIVLLIACANLANFLLARAAGRQREIATRLALGSSRARIVRQSFIETLILSLLGGCLGLGLAFIATRALIAFVSQGAAYTTLDPTPDLAVLFFTLGISLFTGLLFGLAPAFAAARTRAAASLGSTARTAQSSGGRATRFWPRALVIAQVMLSLLLLVGAGLFLTSMRNLLNQDYGFERTNLLVVNWDAKLAGYKPSQIPALHRQIIERIEALPGVRSAAVSAVPPISPGGWTSTITIPGYTPAKGESTVSILNRVSGQYFETTGISLAAGRPITTSDSAASLKVAVVNKTFAQHFFPKGDPIGHSISIDIDDVRGPWQIVGIARDTKANNPRFEKAMPLVYIPIVQIEPFEFVPPPAAHATANAAPPFPREENQNRFSNVILVRTATDPAKSIADLRRAVAQVDPNLALLHVETIQQEVDGMISHEELISTLSTIFSLLALLLAAIGLYGVMSYNVVRRTNEIGIRLALGAQSGSVLWLVLRESLLLLSIGLALGLPLTLATTRIIRDQLFGITALDAVTFATAIAIVTSMTLVAAWLPACRAARVDPMIALRCD